jgi:hypothetical protein
MLLIRIINFLIKACLCAGFFSGFVKLILIIYQITFCDIAITFSDKINYDVFDFVKNFFKIVFFILK